MRFRAEFIGAIRRGEKTQARRPYTGRDPRFYAGQYRVIERTWDERVVGADDTVSYQPQRQTLDGEYVLIEHVARQRLETLTAHDAAAEGFPTREAFFELWDALYGGELEGWVWVLIFRYATDAPSFLARQQGLIDPPQYVQSQERAIDDLEAPNMAEIAAINNRINRRRNRADRKTAQATLAACSTPEARTAALYALAREHGIDVRSDVRALERRVLDRIGK